MRPLLLLPALLALLLVPATAGAQDMCWPTIPGADNVRGQVAVIRNAMLLGERHGLQQQTSTPPAPDGGLVFYVHVSDGGQTYAAVQPDGGAFDIADPTGPLVPPNGTTRTIQRHLADDLDERGLNVKNFGAKCDYVTDDSAAFQTAINRAVSTGQTVLVPAGSVCVVGGLLVQNASHFKIRSDSDLGATTLVYTGTSGYVLYLSNTSYSSVHGLVFAGPNTTSGVFPNITWNGAATIGVKIDWDGHSGNNPVGNSIDYCEFHNFTKGIEVGLTELYGGGVVGCPETVFSNIHAHECQVGVWLGGAATLDSTFFNPRIATGGDGIYSDGSNFKVFGGTFALNQGTDINWANPGDSPSTISSVYTERSTYFLQVASGQSGVPAPTIVQGCQINSANASDSYYGIKIRSPGALILIGNVLGNGTITNAIARVYATSLGGGVVISRGNVMTTTTGNDPIVYDSNAGVIDSEGDFLYDQSSGALKLEPWRYSRTTVDTQSAAALNLVRTMGDGTKNWALNWQKNASGSITSLWSLSNDIIGIADSFGLFNNGANRLGWYVASNDDFHSSRPVADQGTATTAGQFALSSGFGSTASVAVASGSNDARGQITVSSSGTGQAANPTVTYTFKDGAYSAAPFILVRRNGGNQPAVDVTVVTTATIATITFNGTPVAGDTYTIAWHTEG